MHHPAEANGDHREQDEDAENQAQDEAALARAEERFARHGTWFVLLGRMVPGIRSLVSLPPGLLRMSMGRYVAVTAAGSLAWNALLIALGQQLGSRWTEVESVVAPVATIVAGAALRAAVGGSACGVAAGHRARRRVERRRPATLW